MTEKPEPDFATLLLIFGLAPGATIDQIKERKQFKTRVTHPDIVPPELREKATEELALMNAAWDELNEWFSANPGLTATPTNSAPPGAEPPGASKHAPDDGFADFEDWAKNQGSAWNVDVSLDIENLEQQRRQKMAIKGRRDLVIKAKFVVGIVAAIAFMSTVAGSHNQPARDAWLDNWRQQAEHAVRYGDGTQYSNPQAIAARYNQAANEQKKRWEDEDAKGRPGQIFVFLAIAGLLAWQFHPALKDKTEEWIQSAQAD